MVEQIQHNSARSYSSIILAVILKKLPHEALVVLVYEPNKRPPVCWKLSGGGVKPEDENDPTKTARRELEEETGFILAEGDQLTLLCKEGMGPFDRYLYVAITSATKELKEIGDEGEIISTFQFSEFETMPDFLPNHHELLSRPEVKKNFHAALQEFLNK